LSGKTAVPGPKVLLLSALAKTILFAIQLYIC
jgi:hypothetical protein